MHYPCGENKGTDQLRGYRETDLRLCFRICQYLVFSHCGLYMLPLIELDWEILEQTPIHVKVVKEFGPGSNPISDIIEIFQFLWCLLEFL